MKQFLLLLSFAVYSLHAQDTFSIVALDTVTGEVGSAGASCIDSRAIAPGAKIISDVIPGRGAIHTQSFWNAANQQNARLQMLSGASPQQIMQWLALNDAQGTPLTRQYGAVDFDSMGRARSAAYTGFQCFNWKGHITGPNYAIQGNILAGKHILDSMEARFLRSPGSLADKLMAALQGANVPGADTRCLNEGVSSQSAFIRVARPGDPLNMLYLDLNLPSRPTGLEPIDSLQRMYDNWKRSAGIPQTKGPQYLRVSQLPGQGCALLQWLQAVPPPAFELFVYDLGGKLVFRSEWQQNIQICKHDTGTSGIFTFALQLNGITRQSGLLRINP